MKREEEIQKQILQTRQGFRDHWKTLKEDVDMLRKFVDEQQPKWLKDELQAKYQIRANSRTENAQVPILTQVNKVTPMNSKENKDPIPKLQVHLLINVPDDELPKDVNESDDHPNDGSTYEACIL